jgi:sugar (pentulose or hexulose) kinase
LDPGTIVTLGIHDSNASLLPYLLKKHDEDFTLNSTGTWCVAMHPMDQVYFDREEIGKAVFYNMSAFGQPVKTSILMGGEEFDTYTALLKELNSTNELPEFNRGLYERVIQSRSQFIFPSVVRGTGQFPDSLPRVYENGEWYSLEEIQARERVPEFFYDYPVAYAVLNLSLAIQSRIALGRVGVASHGTIYTEGGFRNNPDYNALISAFFPDATVALTGMKEATSFGAALLARTAMEGVDIHRLTDEFSFSTQAVREERFDGLEEYVSEFMRLL